MRSRGFVLDVGLGGGKAANDYFVGFDRDYGSALLVIGIRPSKAIRRNALSKS
jgi:hypothetical protein